MLSCGVTSTLNGPHAMFQEGYGFDQPPPLFRNPLKGYRLDADLSKAILSDKMKWFPAGTVISLVIVKRTRVR